MNKNKKLLIAIAIFALAMNLRSTFLMMTPLIPTVEKTFDLTGSQIGLLTTIPLLVFGVFSSFMGSLGSRFGIGRIIVLSLIIMIGGVLVRYFFGMTGLFVGTFLIALGIVAGNVLLPALISAFFPKNVAFMTSSYSSIMQVTTGLALASIAPLALMVGWENSTLLWSLPVFVAFLLWIPLVNLTIDDHRLDHKPEVFDDDDSYPKDPYVPTFRSVFKYKLAWYVSIFMGIQSLMFYSISTWLPVILQDRGIPYIDLGLYLSLFQVTSLITTFAMPVILKYMKDQRVAAVLLCAMNLLGLILLYFISSHTMAIIAILALGMASGGFFAIAMMFFVLRTSSPSEAAILSGVGQSIGYILASMAPVAIGHLHDSTNDWFASIVALGIITFFFAYTGVKAGEDKKIPQE